MPTHWQATSRSRKPALVVIVAALLVVAAAAFVWNHGRNNGWWGTSDGQKVLLADPMASDEIAGLTAVHSDLSEPVGFMGKWAGPLVQRWFPPGDDPVATVTLLANEASNTGWKEIPSLSTPESWVGKKPTLHGDASIVIFVTSGPPSAIPQSEQFVEIALTIQ